MTRNKILTALVLVALLVAVPATGALAAGTGIVQGIIMNTDASTHLTTVTVTLIGAGGLAETDQISLETADSLSLITVAANTTLVAGDVITCPTTDTIDPNYGLSCTMVSLDFTDPVITVVATDPTLADQTFTPNLSDGLYFGLITVTVNDLAIGTSVVIDPSTINRPPPTQRS